MGRNKVFILVIIFLVGILLRAPEVLSGNFIFNFDAGRDLEVARQIVENHKLTLIGAEVGSGSAGINGIFQGPGYYYLLAVGYWISSGNPYGALVTMFIFGVATLAAVYWTTHRMFGETEAMLALFLVGVSPLITSQSRFLWAPHPMTILLVFLLYCMWKLPKKPLKYASLAMFLTGLTYHFELAMTVPLALSIFLALILVYRIKDLRVYLVTFLVLVISFAPYILFEIRHGFMAVNSVISYSAPQGPVGSDVWWFRIVDHAKPYLANAYNSFPIEHGLLPEWAFAVLCMFLILSLIYYSTKSKPLELRLLFQFSLLTLIVSYITFLFLNNSIWDYYLIHAHFIYIYAFVYTCTQSRKNFFIQGILGVFLISMVVSSSWRMYSNYTYDLYDFGGVEKIKGKQAAVDYVYQDASGKPFSEFTFVPPIYPYPYDYLFATYGKKKYGYAPGTEKKGLVYLIIEPDPSKPWTWKGWLETVIVDGIILDTVTLPTGHIIQKREFIQ